MQAHATEMREAAERTILFPLPPPRTELWQPMDVSLVRAAMRAQQRADGARSESSEDHDSDPDDDDDSDDEDVDLLSPPYVRMYVRMYVCTQANCVRTYVRT